MRAYGKGFISEVHQMEFIDGIHDIVQRGNSFVKLQEGRWERKNSPREYRYRKKGTKTPSRDTRKDITQIQVVSERARMQRRSRVILQRENGGGG
jgi:hypothetical protein